MSSNVNKPADFAVTYRWQAGSMPPPYHYEYSIRVGPMTRGEIVFHPDYPSDATPRWNVGFSVTEQHLDQLHALIVENDLQHREWPEERAKVIGGSQEWLEITAAGKVVRLPSRASRDEGASATHAFIRKLVPESLWSDLMAKREQYQRDYEDRSQ